ncbi:MAG: phytanoyl-CoA dioxygenase family protein [Deltaproteobacteria bacterium]|nr:phytanoyl-CoA dioxygenase family protein [Deltaproteobacteria bacterium]
MELAHFAADAPPDRILDAIARDGGAIVEDFADPATVGALEADYRRALDAVSWGGDDSDDFFGRKTKRLHGLLEKSKTFGNVIDHALGHAMCERFLRSHARHYRISTGELMAIGPGEKRQMLHRDADSWNSFPEPRPEVLVSVNLALTDFCQENGATVVVPGSHGWPKGRLPQDADPIAHAVMPHGSALLYSGDVWHGGGANQTVETRIGLYWGYLLSWLQPLENHLVTNGQAALEAAPQPAQRLLGYDRVGWHVQP